MKCKKLSSIFIALTMIFSVLMVLNVQAGNIKVQETDYEFIWIDDDGIVSEDDSDGEIPFITSIEHLPLMIQFQIKNGSDVYFGADNEQDAMKNITLSGNALFTGSFDEIPGVTFIDGKNWSIPIIPTMSIGENNSLIVFTANISGEEIKQNLTIGGSDFYNNGTVMSVNPEIFYSGTNRTLEINLQDPNGVGLVGANISLFYIGEYGKGENMDNQTPSINYELVNTTSMSPDYLLEFNITQQTEGQIESGFDDISYPRSLILFASYGTGSDIKFGYTKVIMLEEEPTEPDIAIVICPIGIGRISAVIANIGDIDVTPYLEWNITVKGGILGRLNVSCEDTISSLPVNGAELIRLPSASIRLKLGPIFVKISAIIPRLGGDYLEYNTTASGFVIGRFVFLQNQSLPDFLNF